VTSISFASPGIAMEWGIDRAALGIVLSMELIGMAFGSVFLASVADKIGRRPTVLGCLLVWRRACSWPRRDRLVG
jgi:MFS family permease